MGATWRRPGGAIDSSVSATRCGHPTGGTLPSAGRCASSGRFAGFCGQKAGQRSGHRAGVSCVVPERRPACAGYCSRWAAMRCDCTCPAACCRPRQPHSSPGSRQSPLRQCGLSGWAHTRFGARDARAAGRTEELDAAGVLHRRHLGLQRLAARARDCWRDHAWRVRLAAREQQRRRGGSGKDPRARRERRRGCGVVRRCQRGDRQTQGATRTGRARQPREAPHPERHCQWLRLAERDTG
jgi:hypothetical protein